MNNISSHFRTSWEKGVLATLPLIVFLKEPIFKMQLAAAVGSSFLTVIFFRAARPFFPKNFFKLSRIMALAAFAQTGYYLLDLFPLWTAAAFLLTMEDEKSENLGGLSFEFLGITAFFLAGTLIHGAAALPGSAGRFFTHLAGVLVLLGAVTALGFLICDRFKKMKSL